ncbi:MAG: RNA methyltransferase [Flavobacteriaceae bacterium]
MSKNSKFWIAGRHSVLEALKNTNNKIFKIILQNKDNLKFIDKSLQKQVRIASNKDILSLINNADISHQGFLAEIQRTNLEIPKSEIFKQKNIIILDGINDQRNIGSIIRTAYAFNIKTLIVNKDEFKEKSILLNKTASGILEKIKIFKTSNVVNIIKELKKNNFWIFCFDSNSNTFFDKKILSDKNIFIFGSENKGARSIVKKLSDYRVKIKINPEVDSLNVSTSVASALTILNLN